MAGHMTDEEYVASRFHEAYERLASRFSYTTRPDTRKDWPNVPENNRALMVAVVEDLMEEGVISYGESLY